MNDIMEKVQNGVDFLDEFFQGFDWWNKIDLNRLNIMSWCDCVGGQLERAGLWKWGEDYTFDSELGFDGSLDCSYDDLGIQWTETIIRLRKERYSE